jgi:selenide,water dikinase
MLDGASLPELEGLDDYIQAGCVPGGSQRNFDAYGEHLAPMDARLRTLVCDPQTSGGLLIAVAPAATPAVQSLLKSRGLVDSVIGELRPAIQSGPIVNVSAA